MPRYLIKGETGKTLGPGGYWLGDTLKAVNASLRYESLGMDRLTWTARTADLLAGETTLPDVGQMVELFFDFGSGQARLFRGWVTEARAVNYGTVVVVDGPWQFLRKMTATSSKTLNGSSDNRPTMEFATGSISGHIATLVNRAIAEGAPIQNGGFIGTSYSVPKLKLSQTTYADILAELLRWVPDAVVYFDYQSSATTNPILQVARRSSLGGYSLDAANYGLTDYQVTGRPDLVPTRVELKYVTRGTNQRPVYSAQVAGTSLGSTAPGKNQVIVISGDEADTYLPKDDYESHTVQTANANTTLNNTRAALLPMIPEVVTSRAQFSGRPSTTDIVLANGETITQTLASGGTRTYVQPALQFLNAETGAAVSRIGKHFVLTKEPPQWAGNLLANMERVKITGRLYKLVESTLYTSASGGGGEPAPAVEDWVTAFPWSIQLLLSGTRFSGTIPGYPAASVYLYALDFELETFLTTTNYAVPQTFYKPQDFEYLSPPSGLATNLLNTQNFTPHEGFIELQQATPPSGISPSSKMNLAGVQPAFATMDALARAVTSDLLNFRVRIELGAPSRFDFKTLAGKVRSTPQTNITINS
jgi:hypothetical protein